jgi:hypothetical protein
MCIYTSEADFSFPAARVFFINTQYRMFLTSKKFAFKFSLYFSPDDVRRISARGAVFGGIRCSPQEQKRK